LDLDDIADLHVLGRLAGEPDALGRAGDDDVTGLELRPRRELAEESGQLEHHELRARVLLRHAVHARLQPERRGIELVGAHDPRTHRQVAVEVLALEPLPAVPSLHIADRYVAGPRVPGDVLHRAVLGGRAAALPAGDR